ncbi:MAG: hypothetical protein Q8J67_04670 [Rhodocyclaceae bacterium]|nr:hypothetical protein [Rhodocyclaceae bacterium]MDP2108324.1 hypothetical protein [Rhodocyclaceae bacterium]
MSNQVLMRDQADGLRRLFGASAVTLSVAARETDVIDAYARIKRVAREQGCGHFRITITHARSALEAQAVFDNLQRVTREYLGVRLDYLGMTRVEANGAATYVCPNPSAAAGLWDSVL